MGSDDVDDGPLTPLRATAAERSWSDIDRRPQTPGTRNSRFAFSSQGVRHRIVQLVNSYNLKKPVSTQRSTPVIDKIGLQSVLKSMVVTPGMLRFRDVDASFAVVIDQPNHDDFAFLGRELDVADKASIPRYFLETHRLKCASA